MLRQAARRGDDGSDEEEEEWMVSTGGSQQTLDRECNNIERVPVASKLLALLPSSPHSPVPSSLFFFCGSRHHKSTLRIRPGLCCCCCCNVVHLPLITHYCVLPNTIRAIWRSLPLIEYTRMSHTWTPSCRRFKSPRLYLIALKLTPSGS